MTIPNFLSNSYAPFRYYQTYMSSMTGIYPVIRTELTALGWTEVGGVGTNVYQCPSDTAGNWMRCAFTTYSSNYLVMAVTDQASRAVSSRSCFAYFPEGSNRFTLCTGKFHCYIEATRPQSGADWSTYTCAFLLDTSPDDPAANPSPFAGGGSYDAIGGNDGYSYLNWWWAVDNGASGPRQRLRGFITPSSSYYNPNMASGRMIFDECLIYQLIGGGGVNNYLWTGRFCQALLGSSWPGISGAEYRVPIDDGTVGIFRACPVYIQSQPGQLYMRKA